MKLYMPTKLLIGEGSVRQGAGELRRLGRACLIVTSRRAARLCGALKDAEEALASQGIAFRLFEEIEQNPSVAHCIAAGKAAADLGADFILGIGGGSPMDAAKAIAVFAANPALDEEAFYAKAWPQSPLPIALMGTTAGTGSEVTMVSVLTDGRGRKHSIHDERLYARVAFGDARYLDAMPEGVRLSTGIDALSHCVESYFSKKADAFSRAYALEGIRTALAPLKRLAQGGADRDDLHAMYLSSIYGGLAINVTGTCFPHNVGYYLTERFHVPHGAASAAFLGDLLAFEKCACPALYACLIAETGFAVETFAPLIARLMAPYNIKINQTELEAILPRWRDNGSVRNTMGDADEGVIRQSLSKFVQEA